MDNSQILTIALVAVPNMLAVLAGTLINNLITRD
jgi:putative Ca2+/H+ antiporter (TMEM165/GDT1 family)